MHSTPASLANVFDLTPQILPFSVLYLTVTTDRCSLGSALRSLQRPLLASWCMPLLRRCSGWRLRPMAALRQQRMGGAPAAAAATFAPQFSSRFRMAEIVAAGVQARHFGESLGARAERLASGGGSAAAAAAAALAALGACVSNGSVIVQDAEQVIKHSLGNTYLLLVGPPSAGKSRILTDIKRGFELALLRLSEGEPHCAAAVE